MCRRFLGGVVPFRWSEAGALSSLVTLDLSSSGVCKDPSDPYSDGGYPTHRVYMCTFAMSIFVHRWWVSQEPRVPVPAQTPSLCLCQSCASGARCGLRCIRLSCWWFCIGSLNGLQDSVLACMIARTAVLLEASRLNPARRCGTLCPTPISLEGRASASCVCVGTNNLCCLPNEH